jgi:DNA-binding MarR family transcriptional regulator
MSVEKPLPVTTPCLCNALRRAARAVSRLYEEEMRGTGLRITQYSLLRLLHRVGEVRQRELSGYTLLDETSLTRALRPLVQSGWVATRAGDDRREKWVAITAAGVEKLEQARPAWERAQERTRSLLPDGVWQELMAILPEVARRTDEA